MDYCRCCCLAQGDEDAEYQCSRRCSYRYDARLLNMICAVTIFTMYAFRQLQWALDSSQLYAASDTSTASLALDRDKTIALCISDTIHLWFDTGEKKLASPARADRT